MEESVMAMALANCDRCGRLFNKTTRGICPNCVREEEQVFEEIKAYIRANDAATIEDVASAIGVDEELVLQYLQEGRLEITESLAYPCLNCGKFIKIGKYCKTCSEELESSMLGVASELKKKLETRKATGAYFSQRDDLKKR